MNASGRQRVRFVCRVYFRLGFGFDFFAFLRLNQTDPIRKVYLLLYLFAFLRLGRVGLVNLLFCTNSLGLGVHVPRRVEENNYI